MAGTDYEAAGHKMLAAAQRIVGRISKQGATPALLKALATDLETAVKNFKSAAEQDDAGTIPASATDDPRFTALADDETLYIHGGVANGNPNGPDWTLGAARRWFEYVWANNVGYHRVRPTLLPGSHVLTEQGYQFAGSFQEGSGLDEASEDFNPLKLEIKP